MTGDNLPPVYDNVEDGSSSGNGGMHSSHIGVPSEDRPRKGEMSWIPAIRKAGDIRSWQYKFRTGSGLLLSVKVYRDKAERKVAYESALLKAAAEFEEMCQLIELYSDAGLACEELLDKIVNHYMPSLDID